MSAWTQICGTIIVNTYSESTYKTKYIVENVLNHLPLVHGSEGPIEYYVNVLNGYNVSCNVDDNGNESNLAMYDDYDMFRHQTRAMITIQGDLRDTEFHEVLKEVTKFLSRLSKRLGVDDCAVKVTQYDKTYVFSDSSWLYDNYEHAVSEEEEFEKVKYAEWEFVEREAFRVPDMDSLSVKEVPVCSNCKTEFGLYALNFNRCPMCGAIMKKD